MNRWAICIFASLVIHSLVFVLPLWPSLPERSDQSKVVLNLDIVISVLEKAVPEQKPVDHPEPQLSPGPVLQKKQETPSLKKEKPAAEPVIPGSPAEEENISLPPTPETVKTLDEAPSWGNPAPPLSPVPRSILPADVLSRVSPVYPVISRRRGEEGEVRFLVRIDPAGKVLSAEVVLSSGYPSLDASALEAVRKWAFVPGSPEELFVPVIFRLE